MRDDDSLRMKIVLSVQRALLGNISNSVRGVAVDWDEWRICIIAYFQGEISEDDRETMSCVHTEVAADFIDLAPVELLLKHLDVPAKMSGYRVWIFLRKE